jgi:hypothetical protein
MSTSFSIKGDPDDPECYTPDWESDSDDTNEDDNTSSSSGEFIWKVCTWGGYVDRCVCVGMFMVQWYRVGKEH